MSTRTRPNVRLSQPMLIPTAPRVACRSCRAVFEDVNGHGLCSLCLVEHINGAGELELDDLFPSGHAAPDRRVARPTCRACGMVYAQPDLTAAGLLCPDCRCDLAATAQGLDQRCAAAQASLERAQAELAAAAQPLTARVEAFDAQVAALDPATRARWDAYAERRALDPTDPAFVRKEAATLAAGGPLADLIRAKRELDDYSAALNDQQLARASGAVRASQEMIRQCAAGLREVEVAQCSTH